MKSLRNKTAAMLITILCLSLLIPASSWANSKRERYQNDLAENKSKLSALSIPFIENRGQAEAGVQYYAPTFGGSFQIMKNGELQLILPAPPERGGLPVLIRERLVTAKELSVRAEGPAVTKVNYFIGQDRTNWRTNLPTYEAVSLGQVYDGIELKLKAYGSTVEKLFFLRPGADPRAIRVAVNGIEKIQVLRDGRLAMSTPYGPVHLSKPIAYQTIAGKNRPVEVAYRSKRKQVEIGQHGIGAGKGATIVQELLQQAVDALDQAAGATGGIQDVGKPLGQSSQGGRASGHTL